MHKNKNIFTIINYIIQKQQKKYNSCLFKKSNNIQIKFLYFLWINKFIYGYKNINKNYYMIFLKIRIKNNKQIFKKYNLTQIRKDFLKKKNWNKNNFFIIHKNNMFFTLAKIILFKIGGFISYKIS